MQKQRNEIVNYISQTLINKYQKTNTKFQVPNTKYQIPNTKFQIQNDYISGWGWGSKIE